MNIITAGKYILIPDGENSWNIIRERFSVWTGEIVESYIGHIVSASREAAIAEVENWQ